jgi:cyclophilin family peptidyl-prolyl cis-trans isomerase
MNGAAIPFLREIIGTVGLVALLTLGSCREAPLPPRPEPPAEALLSPVPEALIKGTMTHPKAPDSFRVRCKVADLGDFVIEVTRAWAPRAADRFHDLVQRGFYDQAPFYRVIEGFVVQFGRSAWPEANQRWVSDSLPDETNAQPQKNLTGTVTFAQGNEPNSRTTEIFINLRDNSQPGPKDAPSLDEQGFLPFGRVVEGMGTVQAIYRQYGDMAPLRQDGGGVDPGRLSREGLRYILESFPMMDRIEDASIE